MLVQITSDPRSLHIWFTVWVKNVHLGNKIILLYKLFSESMQFYNSIVHPVTSKNLTSETLIFSIQQSTVASINKFYSMPKLLFKWRSIHTKLYLGYAASEIVIIFETFYYLFDIPYLTRRIEICFLLDYDEDLSLKKDLSSTSIPVFVLTDTTSNVHFLLTVATASIIRLKACYLV